MKPPAPSTFRQLINEGGDRYGDNLALVSGLQRLSYAQLRRLTEQLAGVLCMAGVAPGDRVAIALPNDWSYIVSLFATIMAEAIAVPLDPHIRPLNFSHIASDADVKALILDDKTTSRLAGALISHDHWQAIITRQDPSTLPSLPDTFTSSLEYVFQDRASQLPETFVRAHPTTAVTISYTSGSTGKPKGVVHSHDSWISGAAFTADYFAVSQDDKILIPLPVHHAYSFRHVLAYLLRGASIVITDDVLSGLKLLEAERPNAILLVPTACNLILKYFQDLISECDSFLDFVSVGTASMSTDQLEAFQSLLPNTRVHLPYGLTEARVGFLRVEDPAEARRIFAIQPGLNVCVKQRGETAKKNEVGEIVLRGSGLMLGYWHDDSLQRQQYHNQGFATGDLGMVAGNGEVRLVGRKDDLVNIDGRKVFPQEVERVLNTHPAIFESAVVDVPDPEGLADRRLKAIIVLREGQSVTELALATYCRENLEPYKVPSSFVFQTSLPRSSVGKILKQGLREEIIV